MSAWSEFKEAVGEDAKLFGFGRLLRGGGALLWALFVVSVLYVALSVLAFRFNHSWMTETELLLHFPEAVTWQTVEKN